MTTDGNKNWGEISNQDVHVKNKKIFLIKVVTLNFSRWRLLKLFFKGGLKIDFFSDSTNYRWREKEGPVSKNNFKMKF